MRSRESKAPDAAAEQGGIGTGSADASSERVVKTTRSRGWLRHLAFTNIGAIYVWIAIIVMFSVWRPDIFPTWQTAQSVVNQNAISGLIALALVVPLSARVFDLSVGSAVGMCNVLTAWLLVNHGVSLVPAIALTVAVGLLIGMLNASIVVGLGIDSFIATLATGSLMGAAVSLLSNDQSIIGDQLGGTFGSISTVGIGGVALPVFLMFGVAICLWYLLNYTVAGRRIYATGFNTTAAQLAGIRTHRVRFWSLVVSGVVAGIAGVLLTSQVSSGSPSIGPPYLLDAFAAAFLGATQFGGRFNAWGTVVAVLLLGTGKLGLITVGAPNWGLSMFSGVVLLAALAVGNIERMMATRAFAAARRRSRTGGQTPDAS